MKIVKFSFFWANSYNPEFTLTLQGCYVIGFLLTKFNININRCIGLYRSKSEDFIKDLNLWI